MDSFDQTLELLKILKILSQSKNITSLASPEFSPDEINCHSSRISFACDYVNANFQKKITLTEIANKINMSVPAFCRYFKKHTGKTFLSFLNEMRIGHACKIMVEGNMSISMASMESGFNNLSHFNDQFKRVMNLTPTEYLSAFKNDDKSGK